MIVPNIELVAECFRRAVTKFPHLLITKPVCQRLGKNVISLMTRQEALPPARSGLFCGAGAVRMPVPIDYSEKQRGLTR